MNLVANLPENSTLVLAGSGEYLPGMETIDRHMIERLAGPARVVCLATAAGTEGEERLRYWSEMGVQHFSRLGVASVDSVPVIDRAGAQDAALVERIRSANFIYLSGGKPAYLYNCLSGTPAWDAVNDVLAKGGVVAGCSAGAMIFGERIPGRKYPWSFEPGFGYLPGTFIVPHFDEMPDWLNRIFHFLAGGYTMVGIEGDTILACTSQTAWVEGKGGVTILKEGQRTRYRAEE